MGACDITILTEGNSTIGFGHIRRTITLAQELGKAVPTRVWVISNSRELERRFVTQFRGLKVGCGPHPDHIPDLQIIDLEPDTASGQINSARGKVRQLCLDYFNPDLLPTSTINLLDHSQAMKGAYDRVKQSSQYMEGPQYAIIRPTIFCRRPTTLPIMNSVNHVVITFGGADPAGHTFGALKHLTELIGPSVRVTVILGPLTSSCYEKMIRTQSPHNAVVLKSPDNYESLVASADLVLSNGGGTLLESLCLGKATVVFPETDAEENHARFHSKAGACVMKSELRDVLDNAELRSSLAINAYRRVDGRGVKRIAANALKLLSMERFTHS